MKRTAMLSLLLALSTSSLAFAQSGGMTEMETKKQDGQTCMDMHGMKEGDAKGMDMKGMDMQQCKDMMKGMDHKSQGKAVKKASYKATGVVKSVDPANGKVTLAHEPVKSLNWPAMTMSFGVKDKMLFDKLAVDKKVSVVFVRQGSDYVVTAVK